ncbi:hypothetical protein BKN38_02530 [Helicobacter sp. CLO-3]|nr:hypothetical protein BA723_00505 [Helicobacter sp. CLO-3]OHU84678.1 hypothetical protein BKN38_02530 [Helicobacter sp. CLO-3]
MQRIKITKILRLFGLVWLGAHACAQWLHADFNQYLPREYTLNGVSETQQAHAYCTWLQCVFNPEQRRLSSFTLSNSSSTRAALTISLVTPTPSTPPQSSNVVFYINSMNLNPNTGLIVDGFDGVIMDGNSTWRFNNSSFSFAPKTQNTGTFTAYSNSLIDLNNSQFTYTSRSFTSYADINLSNSSLMTLQLNSASIYGDIVVNSGSSLSIDVNGGGGTLLLSGQESTGYGYKSSTASIINNGGKVSIVGNVSNGGLTRYPTCTADYCGAGAIINNSGSMIITGKITSENHTNTNNISSQIIINGGTLDAQGGVENKSGAQISINGGTLETPTLQNQAGGTISFGADSSGNMGQIKGYVTNNGSIVVDTTGAKVGDFQLIQGTLSGANQTFTIKTADGSFTDATQNSGSIKIELNQGRVNNFQSTLAHNQRTMLTSISQALPDIYTAATASTISAALDESASQVRAQVLTPFILIDLLSAQQGSALTHSGMGVRAIGGAVLGSEAMGLGGGLAGASVYGNFIKYNNTLYAQADYAYTSASSKDTSFYQRDSRAHIGRLSLIDRLAFGRVEVDIGGEVAFGNIAYNDSLSNLGTTLSSQNKSNFYAGRLKSSIGYRLKYGKMQVRPSLGVGFSYHYDSAWGNALGLNAPSFSSLWGDALAGIEAKYMLKHALIVADVAVEQPMFNTRSIANIKAAGTSDEVAIDFSDKVYQTKIGARLGVQSYIRGGMFVSADISYRRGVFGVVHFIGVNGSFGMNF